MLKRFIGIAVAVIGMLVVVSTAQAKADTFFTTSCVRQPIAGSGQVFDPIQSGLWSGVNLDIGGLYTSGGIKVPNPANNTCPQINGTQPMGGAGVAATPPATNNGTNIYAALGDSVAAGVGLPNVSPVASDQTRCGRTQSAYAYEVAAALNLGLVHNACSGATVGDLFTKQRSGSPNLPPQLDAAFARGTPQLITITAGANDAHWVQLLQSCYATNCATASQTAAANALLAALQTKLLVLFPTIQARSHGHPPEVIMTGYYNPVSSACTALTQNITPDEITWINGEVTALNQTLQNTASLFPFVHFAPVDFTGHDICSSDSWVQGLNDPQPFHPTVQGQHVYAQAVLAKKHESAQ